MADNVVRGVDGGWLYDNGRWVAFGPNPGPQPTTAPGGATIAPAPAPAPAPTPTPAPAPVPVPTGNIPPRPQFFSPMTPQEAAAVAAWDAQYGGQTPAPAPALAPAPQPTVQPQAGAPPPAGTTQSSLLGPYTGNTTSPTDFYGTLPRNTMTFGGFPEGTGNQALLPGFGTTQQLDQFGIAGLERNQLKGGGSWAGTVWNPVHGQATFIQNPLTFPETAYYDQYGNPKPQVEGNMGIRPASPWYTTHYLQTYGGVPAPFANIHQQTGAAMAGVPAAYPGFKWASPEMMALGQKGATGTPPGGWTQMLGYTPGAPTNYGFTGGRANPYGFANVPLTVNPAAG